MKNYTLICLTLSLILWSCQKDDSTQEPQWNLSISSVTDCSAILTWSQDIDTTQENTYYEIWLNSSLLKRSSNSCDTLEFLTHKTLYAVKVVAIENGISKYSVENSFFTKENYPPIGLTISLDSLKSTSVLINRSNASDPERKPLTYEVSVNGVTLTIEAAVKHITINNLKPNSQNTIRVTATDNMNNKISVSSNVFTPANENSILYRYYINVNGKKRESSIYLPENYKQSSNLPLLFFFHGAGSYGWDMAQLTNFRNIAEKDNVVLVYPQATIYDQPDTPSWCVDPGFSTDDLPFAKALIDNLLQNFSINPNRVYSSGMSSGGYMSFYLALHLPNKIAAIAPVAAAPTRYNFSNKIINRPIPLIYIYGTLDSGISGSGWALSVAETLDFWAKNNGCDTTPTQTLLPNIDQSNSTTVTLFTYPNTTNSNKILYYRINGGGHWWPGRDYAPTDIVAETVIWDFFKPIIKP